MHYFNGIHSDWQQKAGCFSSHAVALSQQTRYEQMCNSESELTSTVRPRIAVIVGGFLFFFFLNIFWSAWSACLTQAFEFSLFRVPKLWPKHLFDSIFSRPHLPLQQHFPRFPWCLRFIWCSRNDTQFQGAPPVVRCCETMSHMLWTASWSSPIALHHFKFCMRNTRWPLTKHFISIERNTENIDMLWGASNAIKLLCPLFIYTCTTNTHGLVGEPVCAWKLFTQ